MMDLLIGIIICVIVMGILLWREKKNEDQKRDSGGE